MPKNILLKGTRSVSGMTHGVLRNPDALAIRVPNLYSLEKVSCEPKEYRIEKWRPRQAMPSPTNYG